jgi:DNA-directed RNA polymerase specialized sigma24 family protein
LENQQGAEPQSAAYWAEKVLDTAFTGYIEKMARRRFGQEVLAEEAANYVLDGLSEEDWRRCRQYRGQSQPKTFLISLASNLIEEFSRKRFGRPRPPVWLQAQGEIWVRLWKMVCLERQPLPSVIDRLTQTGQRTTETVRHAIAVIRARLPACGQEGAGECATDDIQSWSDASGLVSRDQQPGTDLEQQAVLLFRRLISSLEADAAELTPLAEEICPEHLDPELAEKLRTLHQQLRLSDEEVLLLKMVFIDGLNKSKAARALGKPGHYGGRIINEALTRLHDAFRACDLDIESFYRAVY